MKVPPQYQQIKRNFGYLSSLHLINVAAPLLLYPYLIRTLGPSVFGEVLFAQSIAAYFGVLVLFGFQGAATRDIATHRGSVVALSRIVSGTLQVKAMIWLLSLVAFFAIVAMIPQLADKLWLCALAFSQTFTQLLFPDWYFQGRERMKYITVITVAVRICVLILTLVLVRGPQDYLLVPAISGFGALASGVVGLVIVARDGISIRLQPISVMLDAIRSGGPLFISNAVVALADRGGAIFIGGFIGTTEVAYYSLAEKVVATAAGFYSAFSRAVLPNLTHSKEPRLSRQVLRGALILGSIGSLLVYLFAPPIVNVLGGSKMQPTIHLLQILALQMIFAATGPLLTNIIVIQKLNRSLVSNAFIGGGAYLLAVGLIAVTDVISPEAVASCLIGSLLVRNAHRVYCIRAYGYRRWVS